MSQSPQSAEQSVGPPWSLTDEDFDILAMLHRRWAAKLPAGSATQYGKADETDFLLMRHAQRNPRVSHTNYLTGEVVALGGRKQR
jgi:hypothetical protein